MKRAVAIVVATLLAVPLAARAAPAQIELTIAKTQKRIYAYGSVTPPDRGRKVRIRLFHDSGDGYEIVATIRDELSSGSDYDGDGTRESRYGTSFRRPLSGLCRVRVSYLAPGGARETDAVDFGCAIPAFSTGTASITSDSGAASVEIQIADDDSERGYGLMYRRWLAADKGMAFLFQEDTTASFWMENTLLPLSIAFFDSTGQILRIMDMDPCEESPCPLYKAGVSYRGALEVNQGAFTDWGVTEGDVVTITEN